MSSLSTTEQFLLDRYGPLIPLAVVAQLLGRTPAAIRRALAQGQEWSSALEVGRRQFGRRVYFLAAAVAKLIEGEQPK